MKEIFERRSIRKYMDKPVEDEDLQKLLRAAMYAPSAGNEHPWHFVVVKNRETLLKIPTFHPHTMMLKEAPLAIVVCGDTSNLKYDGLLDPGYFSMYSKYINRRATFRIRNLLVWCIS